MNFSSSSVFACQQRERLHCVVCAFEMSKQMKLPHSNTQTVVIATYIQLPENSNKRQANLYNWSLYYILFSFLKYQIIYSVEPYKTNNSWYLFNKAKINHGLASTETLNLPSYP